MGFTIVDSVFSKLSSCMYVLVQLSKYCPIQVLMTAYHEQSQNCRVVRIDSVQKLETVDSMLPLHILGTAIFIKSKSNPLRGSEIHSEYSTRGSDNSYRTVIHMMG